MMKRDKLKTMVPIIARIGLGAVYLATVGAVFGFGIIVPHAIEDRIASWGILPLGVIGIIAWRGSWALLPIRVYLAVVFLSACWFKIADPHSFALDVATYDILPVALINPMALLLPWVEALAGVMLLIGFRVRSAALLTAGMMIVFIVALSVALARGLDMSCGCFASSGANEDPISVWTLVRDGVWLAMSLAIVLFDHQPPGVERLSGLR